MVEMLLEKKAKISAADVKGDTGECCLKYFIFFLSVV